MNDRELLEFIAAQVGNLTQNVETINKKIETLNKDIIDLKKGQDATNKTLVRMENDNNTKFTALFDGYKQNDEKLERIEKEVTKQEEIIMRRVK
ncbi:MAG TPA: hypothetical protein VHT34_13090 [Clostridia bacterium]|nr:hypothetical protein [Clostridia bacterium]